VNDETFDVTQPDPAFDRLRGADPAATSSPDVARLRSAVDVRIAATPVDELATRRKRRARWYLAAGAAAAGAVVIATGGFAAGAMTASSPATQARAPFTLTNAAAQQNVVAGAAAGYAPAHAEAAGNGAAPAPVGPINGAKGGAMMPYGYGAHTVFTAATTLSASTGTATAYAYDAASVDREKVASELARALGLSGTASLSEGAWGVGSTDGTGPSLSVAADGTASVNYYDPTSSPYGCAVVPAAKPDVAPGTPAPVAPSAAVPNCTANHKPLPSPTEAIATAKHLMQVAGLDLAGYEWTADTQIDSNSVYVTAAQVVDNQQTGVLWSVTVVGGGDVNSMYGSLAPVVSLGAYDIVSAQDAVARLSDPEFGNYLGGPIYAMNSAGANRSAVAPQVSRVAEATPGSPNSGSGGSADGSGTTTSGVVTSAPQPTPTVPTTPAAGSAFSWQVNHVIIVKAELGLAQYTEPNGSVVLLPTYQLTGNDKSTWTVIALNASALDTTVPSN